LAVGRFVADGLSSRDLLRRFDNVAIVIDAKSFVAANSVAH
jgi:hypothetical protein